MDGKNITLVGAAASLGVTGLAAWVASRLYVDNVRLSARVAELQGGLQESSPPTAARPRRRRAGARLEALRVRGSFGGVSGYDHHVREFVRELVNQGLDIELIDIPEWGPVKLFDGQRDAWFDTLSRPVNAGTVLHFCMPHQVVPDPQRLNVSHTMFEATRIPSRWVEHHRRHDLIILPTESSRRAWIASGVPAEKIRLCPLGINADLFSQPTEPLPLKRDGGEPVSAYRTRFLNVAELGPRKNHLGLLRAWLRATTPSDDAILILKVGIAGPGWWEEFQQRIELVQKQVGKGLKDAAPIKIVRRIFADADMPRLYAAATHYISLSFGEGWDQAMVEAAASGLRLIAPNHSAYTTYLDPSVATLIPSREVPVEFPGGGEIGALFRGMHWWEPDEEQAAIAIRAAIDGRDAPEGSARDRVLAEFTWRTATSRLIAILSELEATRV